MYEYSTAHLPVPRPHCYCDRVALTLIGHSSAGAGAGASSSSSASPSSPSSGHCPPGRRPGADLGPKKSEDNLLEALVEDAVDDKVGEGVEDEEEMVHRGHAHVPDRREEVVTAANHLD